MIDVPNVVPLPFSNEFSKLCHGLTPKCFWKSNKIEGDQIQTELFRHLYYAIEYRFILFKGHI